MVYSSWGHKESDTIEATKHACMRAAQQRNKQSNQKVGRRPKQTFLQEDAQMDNKHMKNMLNIAYY